MNKVIPVLLLIMLFSCGNPYKGFHGVDDKGMKTNKPPSVEIREDYDKQSKKMKRQYKREMKRRKRRLGSKEK
jgi:hypothetical protein